MEYEKQIAWDFIANKYPDHISLIYSTKKKFDRSLVTEYVKQPDKSLRLLDAGCGIGSDIVYFCSQFEVTGFDFSRVMCKRAEQHVKNFTKCKVRIDTEDLRNIRYPDESFDIITCFSVIDHIPTNNDREQALKELSRVTKPGGLIVITVPNAQSIIKWICLGLNSVELGSMFRTIPSFWDNQEGIEIIENEELEENNPKYPYEHYFNKNEFLDLVSKVGLKINDVRTGVFEKPHIVFNDKELRAALDSEKSLDDGNKHGIILAPSEHENFIRTKIKEWNKVIPPDERGFRLGIVATKEE